MVTDIMLQEHNPQWAQDFQILKAGLWPIIRDLTISIEHVGSTSVPGLAAKPILDLDIVIASSTHVRPIVERLEKIGYKHQGNLGIEGREAFRTPLGSIPHHLYVCINGCLALRNHLLIRDSLRSDPVTRSAYAELKRELALKHGQSIDAYVEGKTHFLLSILKKAGVPDTELETIRHVNAAPQAS